MRILFFSSCNYDRREFTAANAAFGHELTFLEDHLRDITVPLARGYTAICTFVNDKLDATTLQQLAAGGTKLIALRCAGYNQVDPQAANENGLTVVRVPAYSPYAVAEHAVGMILTLNRKFHRAYNRVREDNFSIEGLEGFDIHGKTIGVIGLGRIGRVFGQIMFGFGCKVLAYDPYISFETLNADCFKGVSFDELLVASDIVSLHCPLTAESYHLMGEQALTRMKTGAMLINTSRGGLLDTESVIRLLKSGHLGALGLDVYEQEDNLFYEDLSSNIITDDVFQRLLTFPNVLITAHQAFFTKEALSMIAATTLKNVADFEAGRGNQNQVVSTLLKTKQGDLGISI